MAGAGWRSRLATTGAALWRGLVNGGRNMMGIAGATVSDLLLQTLGLAAAFLVPLVGG